MSIHTSTASNLLDKIERAGLVRRERKHADQRVVQLYLTENGEQALDKAPQPLTGMLTHALGQLSDDTLSSSESGSGHADHAHGRGRLPGRAKTPVVSPKPVH
jgi:DNA-binding MarR family transcriptional regulator